jgi:hypothetical protein
MMPAPGIYRPYYRWFPRQAYRSIRRERSPGFSQQGPEDYQPSSRS